MKLALLYSDNEMGCNELGFIARRDDEDMDDESMRYERFIARFRGFLFRVWDGFVLDFVPAYSLRVNGVPVASFRHFGDANHAAFDDLPGFAPLADETNAITEVFNSSGVRVAHYQLGRTHRAIGRDL